MKRGISLCILCAAFALPPVASAAATPSLSLLSVELPTVTVEAPLLGQVEVPPPSPPPTSPSSPGGETPGAAGGGTKGTATTASVTSPSNQAPTAVAAASTVAAAEPTGRLRASRRRQRTNAPRPVGHGGAARLLAVSYPTAPPHATGPSRGSAAVYRARKTDSSNPLDALGRHIPIPLPVPDWSKPIIALLLLVALWFGARSRLATSRAHRLEGQRDVLLQDLGVMQTTLVPVIPRRLGGLAVSVAYRPADGPAAGGDFYDVFELDAGRVAVLLGDVAGHGHEALTQAALTRYTLRAYLQAGLEPRAALALAGSVLADAAAAHYATVAVGVYDGSRGTLTYASAGHPPPILTGFEAPEPLTVCCSPPVGWDVPTGRRQTTISLPAGAIVCFFSDGLIEARTADGLLGRERLAGILAELGPRPSSSDLLERVQTSAESTPDDMVSCILVPQVSVASVSCHVEELEVDAAELDGDGVERFLGACGAARPEITSALARARDVLATGEAAVLHVECEPGGRSAAIAVLPGLEAPIDAPAHDRSAIALVADVATADAGRPRDASRTPA